MNTTPRELRAAAVGVWREAFGIGASDDPDMSADLYTLGGDSMLAVKIVSDLAAVDVVMDLEGLLGGATLGELLDTIGSSSRTASQQRATDATHVPMLPAQYRWVGSSLPPEHDHFVLKAVFGAREEVDASRVRSLAQVLLSRHPVLRTQWRPGQAGLLELAPVDIDACVRIVDVDASATTEVVESVLSQQLTMLSLAGGRVLSLTLVRKGGAPHRLMITVHHFVLDGWSFGTLLAEVKDFFSRSSVPGATDHEPDAGVDTYRRFIEEYCQSPQAREDARFWLSLPLEPCRIGPEDNGPRPTLGSLRTATARLTSGATQAFLMTGHAETTPVSVLAAACLVATREMSNVGSQACDVYSFNRELRGPAGDWANTVGYIQSTSPVVATQVGTGTKGVSDLIAADFMASPPRFGYDALRYLSPTREEREALSALRTPDIRINYRGHFDRLAAGSSAEALFDVNDNVGPNRSRRQSERYLLMFEGDVSDGELVVGLRFSTADFEPRQAQHVVERVADLVAAVSVDLGRPS